jgi:hypothetical protein
LLVAGFLLIAVPPAWAECTVVRESAGERKLFLRHLNPDCSKVERVAHAIEAREVLAALKAGKGVSLDHVVLVGDLLVTQLPAVPLASVPVAHQTAAMLSQAGVKEVRLIGGPLIIQNSIVDGVIDTQRKPDMTEHQILADRVIIQGPVSFKGSTFTKDVDLSKTVFLEPVDSSETVYLGDALFLSCIFTKATTFEKTAFSGNTRFYQSIFQAPVTFLRAGFSGLTNFLSVTFEKEASFSRAYFKMGTGFSGSRFEGISDFSEAVFEKAVFFMHAVFQADAYFRRATFRGEVNFTDAAFKAKDDFAKVFYKQEPNFTRTTFGAPRSTVGFENPVFLAIVVTSLVIFLIAFIIMLKKG